MRGKPTENQIKALRLIDAGKVTMMNCGTSAYRTFVAGEVVSPAVIGRVVSLGWAVWPKGPVGDQACEITATGRELIENRGTA